MPPPSFFFFRTFEKGIYSIVLRLSVAVNSSGPCGKLGMFNNMSKILEVAIANLFYKSTRRKGRS